MAEYKQYITQIQDGGNVMISEDVITTIVEHTLTDVEGVDSLSTKPGADIADLIGKNWGKGMKIQISGDKRVLHILSHIHNAVTVLNRHIAASFSFRPAFQRFVARMCQGLATLDC